MDPLLFIEPFKNFVKLCPNLVFQYKIYRDEIERDNKLHSLIPYKDIEQMREHIAIFKPFDGIIAFDVTRRKEVADNLNIFYRKILEQPFWYLEAVELHPDNLPAGEMIFERAKSLFNQIEHAKDKFDEMIVSVNRQFNDLVDSDKEAAYKLFNKILFTTENLILYLGRNSIDQWHFDYKHSPLFIFLMEFIQKIKNRAGNSAAFYPEIEDYFKNIDSYRSLFEYNSIPALKNDKKDIQYNFDSTMTQIPEEKAQQYAYIFGKLMEAKNPAIMLKELKDNGFKYISEDFQKVINQYISEENKLIAGLIMSNPQSKPENIGIPGLKNNIIRAIVIRELFETQMTCNRRNQIIAEALITWKQSKFFKTLIPFLLIIDIIYIREGLSDDMIYDFLTGFEMMPKRILEKDENLGAEIDILIKPVLDKILHYMNTEYLRYNTQHNIDTGIGLEKLTIDGLEIPITPEKIIRFIRETNSPFFTEAHIIEAKHGFIHQQRSLANNSLIRGFNDKSTNQNQMDYLQIVLGGYSNNNERAHFPQYLYREFKNAEKKYFGIDEFFKGCFQVTDYLASYIKHRFSEEKNELLVMKNAAENRTIKFTENNSSKTHEQQCIETIEFCDKELKNMTLEWFPVNLSGITNNKFHGNLPYSQVLWIIEAINEALQKVTNEQRSDILITPSVNLVITNPSISNHNITEPVNMVKAWVVRFEKNKSDKSVQAAIERIKNEHKWNGSLHTIKNKYAEIINIENTKRIFTEKQKVDLFNAIALLSEDNKSKARLYHSRLM